MYRQIRLYLLGGEGRFNCFKCEEIILPFKYCDVSINNYGDFLVWEFGNEFCPLGVIEVHINEHVWDVVLKQEGIFC